MGDDAAPPIGIAYLAAMMESLDHEVTVVDAPGEALGRYAPVEGIPGALRHGLSDDEIIDRIPVDTKLIGLSCMFSLEWLTTRELARKIRLRFPSAVIVAGGEHFTALPEYTLNDCDAIDFCVLGEGEQTLADLVEALENHRDMKQVAGICWRGPSGPARTSPRPRLRKLHPIPNPAWHLVPVENYLDKRVMAGIDFGRSMPILASRGCPYRCTFCSSPFMWGTLWRVREPEDVLDEMQNYMERYGASNFDFCDLTAILKREWIVKFCRMIIDQGLKIAWQFPSGTRSEALDSEVTKLLNESGCVFITYAPESGSDEMLKRIKKQIDKKKMLRSMRGAVRNGLNVKASFILGFPTERLKHVLGSYRFILQLAVAGIKDVSVFPFSPYPGTELFDSLVKRGHVTLGDDYFRSLVSGTAGIPDGKSKCYSENYSLRMLRLYCLLGIGMFYAASFALRPVRLYQLIRHLILDTPQTRLGRSLRLVLKRRRNVRQASASPQGEDAGIRAGQQVPRSLDFGRKDTKTQTNPETQSVLPVLGGGAFLRPRPGIAGHRAALALPSKNSFDADPFV